MSLMDRDEINLRPVEHITSGAIGPPGKRVFYLQAEKDDQVVTVIVEKEQLQSLAVGVEKFMQDLGDRFPELETASGAYDEAEMSLVVPVDPVFRVGQIGLGYDELTDEMVLVAREIQTEDADPDDARVVRFWCSREQLLSMCNWSQELASLGREICGNCGLPIDPQGHFCPKRNGHKH
jgi:uncharacterized repeat protein (TIGR03847 family)